MRLASSVIRQHGELTGRVSGAASKTDGALDRLVDQDHSSPPFLSDRMYVDNATEFKRRTNSGLEQQQLVRLITERPRVQVPHPQPIMPQYSAKDAALSVKQKPSGWRGSLPRWGTMRS